MEGDGRDGEVDGSAEVEASSSGGAPVGEAGADGQAGGEDRPQIRREGEPKLGLCAGELRVGQPRLDLDAGVAQMGDDLLSEGGEGHETGAGGDGGGGRGSGRSSGEAPEAG